jgi:hypothetical protein
MTRTQLGLVTVTLGLTAMLYADLPVLAQAGAAQAPAAGQAPGGGRGRGGRGGRGQQAPPPPPPTLTCTSPAAAWDNIVPAPLAAQGFVPIFNGRDLTGWQALIDIGTLRFGAGLNPADLDALSPAERAAKQKESNDVYLKHWFVENGVLIFDGVGANAETGEKGGQNLQTVQEYDDVELYVD